MRRVSASKSWPGGTAASRPTAETTVGHARIAVALTVLLIGCVATDESEDPSTGRDQGELDLASCFCANPGPQDQCDTCRTEQAFRLVKNRSVSDVAIAAENLVAVGEEAILEGEGAARRISNVGGYTIVSNAAHISADIQSIGPVWLNGRAFVDGSVDGESWVGVGHRATVRGAVHSHVSLSPTTTIKWAVSFPRQHGENIIVRGDQTIPPGNYGDVIVNDGGIAHFTSGEYFFRRLIVRHGARVDVATAAGPVFINVYVVFSSDGQWQGLARDLFISSFGVETVVVGNGAFGTIVAPRATIELRDSPHHERGRDFCNWSSWGYGARDNGQKAGREDRWMKHSTDAEERGRRSGRAIDFVGALVAKRVVLADNVHMKSESFGAWSKVVVQGMDLGRPMPDPPPNPRLLHQPPALNATGTEAANQARAFILWAAGAVAAEDDDIHRSITAARFNVDIVNAFAVEVDTAMTVDWSRALVAMTLLGAMTAPSAEAYLTEFVRRQPPVTGTISGEPLASTEPLEAASLTMLQAAAVDGLALIRSSSAKAEVRRIAQEHPSVQIRREAVRAYVANFGPAGRDELRPLLSTKERIFVDIFENRDAPDAHFDAQLSSFLAQHPEANDTIPEGAQ